MADIIKKRILIIDDDEMSLLNVEEFLKNDYEIIKEKSGQSALDLFKNSCYKSLPDLILLDIIMPEMDGWETFTKIKGISLLMDIPIVFMTSVSDMESHDRAIDMGACDYVVKPFDRDSLLKMVKESIIRCSLKTESS